MNVFFVCPILCAHPILRYRGVWLNAPVSGMSCADNVQCLRDVLGFRVGQNGHRLAEQKGLTQSSSLGKAGRDGSYLWLHHVQSCSQFM